MLAQPRMKSLPHRHLGTLRLDIDLAAIVRIGEGRLVAPVAGGTLEGDRISANVLPGGADWVTQSPDGNAGIDVRLTLATDDGATLGLTYNGRFLGPPGAMQRFVAGRSVEADVSLQTVAKFETADPRYAWLNDTIVIGIGEQVDGVPAYQLYEIVR